MAVESIDAVAARWNRVLTATGLALFAVLAILALTWAKWDPYAHKLVSLWRIRHWHGHALFGAVAPSVSSPSWHAAWSFAVSYGRAVWIALVAALLISAAVDALVPQERLVSALSGRGRLSGQVVGGLLALPCMMCTCCSAPLAATLRRRGVPMATVLGYWLGNPVLNPAVLVFLALVAPWQWVTTRVVVGSVLVFGVTALVVRLGDRTPEPIPAVAAYAPPYELRAAPMRFLRTLGRLALVLVPEYVAVVLLVGAFRGWLFPLGSAAAHWGLLAVAVAAVAGTLVVVPTAGEIPVLLGLAAVGVGAGPLGALLITLPAVSLPSLVMVGRALSWRLTAVVAAAVAVTGLAGAALLAALA